MPILHRRLHKLIELARKEGPSSSPFPPILLSALAARGIRHDSWDKNHLTQDHYRRMRCGSCRGLIAFGGWPEAMALVAIANDRPGNGDFARTITALESSVLGLGYPLTVLGIWNARLRRHLIQKRGYLRMTDSAGKERGLVLAPVGWKSGKGGA